eukprot:TRINITY_DN35805_c0_g1_i1.p1 TRINITY_DN35805_c0_g1~~TRINITY_DN35805_c0_g1_i1.p1  ORF type:complete len:731 (+),score=253.64 TRINITY_DN35805_c0_g1_i1:114-2306(+)
MDFVRTVPPEYLGGHGMGDIKLTEDALVENQLLLNDDAYCREEQVRVTCCSWNISQRKPELPAQLAEWLGVEAAKASVHADPLSPTPPAALEDGRPGIIAIGLQEVDMSANALLREETENSKPWIEACLQAAGGTYQKVASRQLAGLLIVVIAKTTLVPHIKNASTAIVRCGAMGNSIANKGAVGVRLILNKTSFCFTTAHLAAHQNEFERRNRDFIRIVETMQFPGGQQLLAHDRVFFFGDLNYRLELTYEEAKDMVKKGEIEKLLQFDQLEQQGHIYCSNYSFKIPQPTFPPTYKYDPGTWEYDTSEKRRIPSWTDRILYRSIADGTVELRDFSHNEKLLASDHRAVSGGFDVKILREDPEIKRQMREDVVQKIRAVGIDKFAETQVALSKSSVDFGNVLYGEVYTQEVTICNQGHGVVLVKVFMPCEKRNSRPASAYAASSWISVSALELRIMPGCSEVMTIKCCVTKPVLAVPGVQRAPFESETQGDGQLSLDQYIVFSAGAGRQSMWFRTLAKYTPSSFGSSLPHLSLLGLVPITKAYRMSRDDQPPAPRKPQVPKELWWLVDYLIRNGKQTPQLFQNDLNMESFAVIRDHLDNKCEALPDDKRIDACAVSQVLLVFLQHLQEPLLPSKHYERLFGESSPGHFIALRDLQLPPPHFNSLTYVVAFLKYLLRPDNKNFNMLTPELLAQGFAPVLFQPPAFHQQTTPEQDDNERVKKTRYLMYLLKN